MRKLLIVLVAVVSGCSILSSAQQPAPPLRDSFKPEASASPASPGRTVRGKATWYDATKNNAWYTLGKKPTLFYAAAGPALRGIRDFRWGKKPYRIIIENIANGKAIVAWVVDWCGCRGQTGNEKLVDLSPAAFEALGVTLGRGVQRVKVTVLP